MYVIQLTTDSEMRHKAWQTIRQCATGTLSKSGQLLERWYKETIKMYANHNDLPDFLDQIPRKESLGVSRTLGATISADNCSTARSTQLRTSKMIIDIARTKGITDKKLLVHHFGLAISIIIFDVLD